VSADSPVVTTTAGAVRGMAGGGLSVFKALPYAAPVTNEARFAPPRPPEPWTGIRDATRYGSAAPQSVVGMDRSGVPSGGPRSDDYLTTNVWTPGLDGARPVMVWFHGGAYLGGSAVNPAFDGSTLARDGDVVVVTANHRVGAEGFLHLQDAVANRGLLDAVRALEWVRENIAAFGGDPGRVTVFGQSAGAGIVASLLAMPRAAGLFRRAIVQSLPGAFLTPQLGLAVADVIADAAQVDADRAGFRSVSPVALAEVVERVAADLHLQVDEWGPIALTQTPFAPVVDDDVLPVSPFAPDPSRWSRGMPLIAGHTRDEFRAFTRGGAAMPDAPDPDRLDEAFRLFAPGMDRAAYVESLRAEGAGDDGLSVLESISSDWTFAVPTHRFAQAQASAGAPTYFYEFAVESTVRGGMLGAPHGADHPLVFGNVEASIGARFYRTPISPGLRRVADDLRRRWTDFAHGRAPWRAYDPESEATMVFSEHSEVRPYPHRAAARLVPVQDAYGRVLDRVR